MIIRLGKLQLRFYISWLAKREGICSKQYGKDDKHMLLWDFDRSRLTLITDSLRIMQIRYRLPSIYIVQSSAKGSYHAYCFCARSFREVINILSDTPEIDMTYLRLGMVRGYYTLRITPREDDDFKLVDIIDSPIPDEMNLMDMTYNEYFTSNKGGHDNAKR